MVYYARSIYSKAILAIAMESLFMCCSFCRDENEDEVFNIGREFDEIYHWHSLKPLSDDHDRTKKGKNLNDKSGSARGLGYTVYRFFFNWV